MARRAFLGAFGAVLLSALLSAQDASVAVGAALDDFHDAAAKADEARYFGLFAPEGVFLGTDATERWTVAEFREWAKPYFARGSAWTFAPSKRHIVLAPGGDIAWFDETLDNKSYGECRGSGVCRRIEGAWKVAHYHLTIPVPNDLAGGVVRMIRGGPKTTTIYLVRHAEKVTTDPADKDPKLTAAGEARAATLAKLLGRAPVTALYATEFQRTRRTLEDLAKSKGLEVATIPAAKQAGMAKDLLARHAGGTVVVCGHTNTLPALIEELGVKDEVEIPESDYERLFVVTIAPTGLATLQTLVF